MPPPQASYVSRTSEKGYDPATLSDDEDDEIASVTSHSTWTSSAAGETTILGLTDGRIPTAKVEDLSNWKISRVGGLPSFPLSIAPSASASHCLSCSHPMPLLVQVYCPLPTSSLERVLYVFACPRPACRRKDGAIRAWRANGIWVEGAVEEARKAEEDERRAREERERDEARKRAQAIDLGGLIFGGAGAASGSSPNPFALPSASSSSSSKPFASVASGSSASNPFAPPSALASNPFAPPAVSAAPNPFATPAPTPPAAPSSVAATPAPANAPLAIPVTATGAVPEPITTSWQSSAADPLPTYPAHYISTMYEPPPASTGKGKGRERERDLATLVGGLALGGGGGAADDADGDDDGDDGAERARPGKGAGGRTKKGAAGGAGRKDGSGRVKTAAGGVAGPTTAAAGGWEGEGYEVQKVKGVDEVFLRFQERVQREGRQVVRYEFGAHPVPYTASSAAYRLAFPPASSSSPHPLVAGATASAAPVVGAYAPGRLAPCRACRGPTAFEAQLMPHLATVVNAASGDGEGQDWATVWVLSCQGECEGGAGVEGESWREERVLSEWEEEAV
ncbi:hypothetical protein JCM3770_003870 [Rhodotorula araucariae]